MKHKSAFATIGVKQPLALMKNLKEGLSVELPDGTYIYPADVVGPSRPGRKFVILGDTSNSDSLIAASQDCDVVVHEATNAKTSSETKSFEEVELSAISHGHSTPQMAGLFARNCNAKMLLLNHFSARYKGDRSEESVAVMKEIEELAQAAFGRPDAIATYDHLTVIIPKP
jgi:ribonuclease Z